MIEQDHGQMKSISGLIGVVFNRWASSTYFISALSLDVVVATHKLGPVAFLLMLLLC